MPCIPMKHAVEQKFESYPDHIKPKMESLRKLIYELGCCFREPVRG